MDMMDIIVKKRDGGKLTQAEIQYFVKGIVAGTIPDYQTAALLMAIYFQELDREEIFELTNAMRYSGDTVDLSSIKGIKVDKHSTGGVGDKTTLIVAPIAAACMVPIAKMSGRGLGFTGGTVDKLESIPGFKTTLEPEAFLKQVSEIGIAVIGQTAHITPADKILYALRDVTGTVDVLGLIASSIMSKKLAAGSDAIVLDVKCGSGAFMEKQKDAEALGSLMCDIGRAAGRRTIALVTDMSQPLGLAVGNSLEVMEAIDTLKGKGPEDITELSINVAGHMIYLGGRAKTPAEGMIMARQALLSGAALKKFRSFVESQGGDPDVTEDYGKLPQSSFKTEINAADGGFVESIDARLIGQASEHTGAGRAAKDDVIDLSAGVLLNKKVGDKVGRGETLAVFQGHDKAKVMAAASIAASAFTIVKERPARPELVKKVLGLQEDK